MLEKTDRQTEAATVLRSAVLADPTNRTAKQRLLDVMAPNLGLSFILFGGLAVILIAALVFFVRAAEPSDALLLAVSGGAVWAVSRRAPSSGRTFSLWCLWLGLLIIVSRFVWLRRPETLYAVGALALAAGWIALCLAYEHRVLHRGLEAPASVTAMHDTLLDEKRKGRL